MNTRVKPTHGHFIANKELTQKQYDLICQKFLDNGCISVEEVGNRNNWAYIGCPTVSRVVYHWDNPKHFGIDAQELTIDQILTPCEQRGWKVGDRFIVMMEHHRFSEGGVVELAIDDGSHFPYFIPAEGGSPYDVWIGKIKKTVKPGDWIRTENIPPNRRQDIARIFREAGCDTRHFCRYSENIGADDFFSHGNVGWDGVGFSGGIVTSGEELTLEDVLGEEIEQSVPESKLPPVGTVCYLKHGGMSGVEKIRVLSDLVFNENGDPFVIVETLESGKAHRENEVWVLHNVFDNDVVFTTEPPMTVADRAITKIVNEVDLRISDHPSGFRTEQEGKRFVIQCLIEKGWVDPEQVVGQ